MKTFQTYYEYLTALDWMVGQLVGKRVYSFGGLTDRGYVEQCELATVNPCFGTIYGILDSDDPLWPRLTNYWGDYSRQVCVIWDDPNETKKMAWLNDLLICVDGRWVNVFGDTPRVDIVDPRGCA